MKLATLTSLLALCSASALATSYQHQTKVDYLWGDLLNTEFNSSVFSQQFYFTPVSVNSNAPFAEAAFISRSSSAIFGYQRSRFDFGDEGKSTASSWALGGEYRSVNHNFYVSALATEVNNSRDRQLETSLGYYLDRNWLVTFDIEHSRPGDIGSSTQFGVSSKKLLALDTGDYLNIEASYMDLRGTNSSRFAVAGDYYFGKTFALGMEYQWLSKGVFSTDADAVTIRTSWHVSPKMALNAGVTFDNLDTGDDLFQLGLNFRF